MWPKGHLLQNKGKSLFKWISKIWYVLTIKYYSAIKGNVVLRYATTQMNLQTPTEVKQVRRQRTNAGWLHVQKISGVGRSTKTEGRLVATKTWGGAGGQEVTAYWTQCLLRGWWVCLGTRPRRWVHNTGNGLNTPRWFASGWLILCHMKFALIKKEGRLATYWVKYLGSVMSF